MAGVTVFGIWGHWSQHLPGPSVILVDKLFIPAVEEKAAAILESILLNHPFVDGNKRTGFYLMLAILEEYGLELKTDGQSRYDFVIEIASGNLSFEEIVAWIRNAVKSH